MNKKMTTCKACNHEIAKSAKVCPHCGAKNKKPIFKKWWFWLVIGVLFISIINSGNDTPNEDTKDSNTSISDNASSNNNSVDIADNASNKTDDSNAQDKTADPAKTEYYVGDVYENGNARIVYVSSGDYLEENEYMQPAEGNKYIYLEFAVENISSSSDITISLYEFECYADGYSVEMYYGAEDDLSAVLSAGRATNGYIYYEIPADAQVVEVEYETNFITEEKIKFIFEGEKDSGYALNLDTSATAGAYSVGDIVESSTLVITYLSCEEYISDNMFIAPAEGYRFVTCEFEFENVGSSDEYISSFDFDCYADGLNCSGSYTREDDLAATLSAGRKAKGTVTFEVPIDATVIEVEYLSNYWTSDRVVFTVPSIP